MSESSGDLDKGESEHQQGQERETVTAAHRHRGWASMNRGIQKVARSLFVVCCLLVDESIAHLDDCCL